jgi:hypothetical protein
MGRSMTRYLLSLYQPDGPSPGPEVMEQVAAELHRLNEDLKAAGSWVFTGGLHSPHSATVVLANAMMTDGPYLEGKEHIGGVWVIDAPDLDAALEWARRAAAATTLPIEVRPFQDAPDY